MSQEKLVILIFEFSVFLWNVNSYLDDICIAGSTIQSAINGRYEYESWSTNYNGPIYYNAKEHKYLYPWIHETGEKQYHIHVNTSDLYANSYCNIPSSLVPMSPYECYNGDGQQLYSWTTSISKFVNDTTAILFKCNSINGMRMQTIQERMFSFCQILYSP